MSFLNVPIAALVTKNTLSSFQREKAIFNDSVRLTTSSLFLLPLVTVFFFFLRKYKRLNCYVREHVMHNI